MAVWHATGVSAMSHAVSVESRAAVGVAEYLRYLNIMQFPLMAGGEITFSYVERGIRRRWSLQVMNAIQEAIDLRWANREIQTAR